MLWQHISKALSTWSLAQIDLLAGCHLYPCLDPDASNGPTSPSDFPLSSTMALKCHQLLQQNIYYSALSFC